MNNINFPRSALLWLLAAISCVYFPLQQHLPMWTGAVFVIVIGWRWLMHLGRLPMLSVMGKVIVVGLAIAAVIISAKGKFHLESATAFILVACLLKVLEIKNQRDGYILIFISFFLLAVNFLYDQGILTTLYSIFVAWLLLAALIALHQLVSDDKTPGKHARDAGKISAQTLLLSLPLMLILFVLFPRIGPLWALNLESGKAKTGLSDQMSPGDIAKLSNSDELVFRAEFIQGTPQLEELYWRALVLDDYQQKDGRALWTVSGLFNDADWFPKSWKPEEGEGVYDYRITQEANNKRWLFGLRGVAAMEPGIGMTNDDRIISRKKNRKRKSYLVRSVPTMKLASNGLNTRVKNQSLLLDDNGSVPSNPKARQLAQQIFLQQPNDRQRMEVMLQYYYQQEFSYTLQPQPMLNNDIDQFLFLNRAGFCAHYASSFAFMMRVMNIPARIVAGYQGGEINPSTGHITVRQYDAHAWVEVWLKGEGWVSVDPTAQVAPNRISQGLRNAVSNEEFLAESNFSLIKLSYFPWMNSLRLKIDEINFQWHQTVLNFNKQKQSEKLKEWFGTGSLKKSLYWLAGLVISVFFTIAIALLWKRKSAPLTPLQKSLALLDKRLEKLELQRNPSEGFNDYSLRLQQAFPQQKESIRRLFEQLQNQYYSPRTSGENKDDEQLLALQIKKLGRKLSAISKNKSSLHQ
jgi:transglutaminase-like putative cysteine protease